MNNIFDINNQNILIFGGTGELFGNLAIELVKLGANVMIIGRSIEKANKIINFLSDYNIKFLKFDALHDDPQFIIDKFLEYYGKIDVLINGMGINSTTPFEEITEDEMQKIFKINYNIPAKCCSLVLKSMKENKNGSIINIGSISGITPLSKVYTYSASKAALHNLTKNLAREYGQYNIRINTLVPGFFLAEQNRKILTEERVKTIMDHTPMNRFGNPNDLLGAILLLSSQAASTFINGTEIIVDGGFNAMKI